MAFMVPKKRGQELKTNTSLNFNLPEVAIRAGDELKKIRNIMLFTSSYTLLIVCTVCNLGNVQ